MSEYERGEDVQGFEPPVGSAPVPSPEDPVRETARPSAGEALWREPVYTAASGEENAYSPTRHGNGYGAAYARQQASRESRPAGRGLRIVCLLLACVLLGAASGAGTALLLLRQDRGETAPATQVVIGTGETSVVTASPAPTGAATDIYELACRQVVGIHTELPASLLQSRSTVSGSGFVISADGYLLTNYHVVEYAVRGGYPLTVVFSDGTVLPGTIVGYEDDEDIAVVKVDAADLEPVTFCGTLRVGETVYAVGNPLGELSYTMTRGIVSALDRDITTSDRITLSVFQFDAAVNEGNSGGPVYNEAGQVLGIVTAKYGSLGVEGIGFAIPIEDAVSIATQLIEQGYVSGKAYLGVSVENVTGAVSSYFNMPVGAYVYSVTPGSAAETAGIRIGDIITAVGDAGVASVADLRSILKDLHAGDIVTVHVYRSGEQLDLTVQLDEELPQESQ